MSTSQLIVSLFGFESKKRALMNLFFEGSVPALMQAVDEQEERERILIFLPEHCVGILYGLHYKSSKRVIAFAGRKCM